MILVDTSVWIEHLRAGSDRLKTLLFDQQVLCHPFVIGELACGMLQKRGEILTMLKALPEAPLLEHEEVISFLDARLLYGRGIGWVDAHLRFDATHRVRNLDLRQAASESSGCLERPGVKCSE